MIKCYSFEMKKMHNELMIAKLRTLLYYLSINCFSIKAGGKFYGNIYGLVTSNIFFISSPIYNI